MSNLESDDIALLMLKYSFALEMLETELNILIKEYEYKNSYNPVEHVKSRIKNQRSIEDKLEKKGYKLNTHNIMNHVHDMIGVRIVCSFMTDIYDIVGLIKNSKQFKIKEEKDYISNPKETGYISYHLILLVPIYLNENVEYVEAEIQIRTIAMDFWASLDHKIQYKFPNSIPERVREELFNCAIDIKSLDHKMNQLNEIVRKYMS